MASRETLASTIVRSSRQHVTRLRPHVARHRGPRRVREVNFRGTGTSKFAARALIISLLHRALEATARISAPESDLQRYVVTAGVQFVRYGSSLNGLRGIDNRRAIRASETDQYLAATANHDEEDPDIRRYVLWEAYT
jgi:hypothetical protein